MSKQTLTPRSFTDRELAEAVDFYEKRITMEEPPVAKDFKRVFNCSMQRASMLQEAAAWAHKVREKEKKAVENKRKAKQGSIIFW